MLNKYEIRTFPECFQLDDSDIETEKLKTTLKLKRPAYVKPKKFYDNNNKKPECIFTDEKKNISFYQSDSNSSFKERNFHSLNQKTFNGNYDSYIMNRKNSSKTDYVTEQFSYNYINTNDSNENTNYSNAPFIQRVSLDTFLSQKLANAPKRTIKSYHKKFDVEKSDNFNVLSYRPEDYESDFIKPNSKSKIGQIFKREDIKEIYNSNKFSKSPPSHLSSSNSSHIKVKRLNYKIPTFQSQSFCGSYLRPKQTKNINQAKSNSNIKKNQLEDFNIDKLIEIGDNCSNKWTNFLSFGKKINYIKRKNKINQLRQRNHDKRENLTEIMHYSPKKKKIEANIKNYNDINDKNVMTKNMVFHAQIKKNRNIKKNKNINKLCKNNNNLNKIKEDMNKTLNINNEKKILNVNDINLTMNDIYFKKTNSNNNDSNINSTNNNTLRSKKINSMLCSMDSESFDNKNKNKGELIYLQITPKKSNQKKKIEIFFNNKNNYSIDSFQNIEKIEKNEEKKNYIKNNAIIYGEKNTHTQTELPKKIYIKTEVNSKVNSKKIMQKSKAIIKKPKIKQLNKKKESINKKSITNIPNPNNTSIDTNTNNVNNNQNNKKNQGIKAKNYYGFDERHNLEGTINNHSYHISIYSRKKVSPKITSIEILK